ncbi:gluconate 2-dehydrogenase subunit 3 family protein [Aestuariivivens insulae]|uniref:gluconate 2-dehydrogenase subunit 3 family protein n=1 Tax=Aestuariivivens insulae TaxID=1621988 RepID=UPI001F5A3621|nr:gluconate 2-dehydrogenase subunit 3 family protein [Aestuariivivens insulae]
MDRRRVLKTIPLSIGGLIATPALMQVLTSCGDERHLQWKPAFLNLNQAFIVEQIANVILPKTDTIGALDVYVPQFLDILLNDVVPTAEQDIFIKGATVFQQKYKALFKKEISNANTEEIAKMISMYFDLNEEDEQKVFELVGSNLEDVKDSDTYYLYKYLYFIRYYSIFAYLTTQEVKEGLLGFNPYLGNYTACTSL